MPKQPNELTRIDLEKIVTNLWEFLYFDDEGHAAPEQEVGGSDLVEYACQLFIEHDLVPDAPTEDFEPQEGDLVTYDQRHFHVIGQYSVFDIRLRRNVAAAVPIDEDWMPHVKAYMDKEKFWPNVWEVSDHGNVSMLRLSDG